MEGPVFVSRARSRRVNNKHPQSRKGRHVTHDNGEESHSIVGSARTTDHGIPWAQYKAPEMGRTRLCGCLVFVLLRLLCRNEC
jgi:hypothetical protein